jgi:N-methylhydantoinase A
MDATSLSSVEAAAAGIIDIVNENMFGALRLVSVQQGFDPRDFALVAFGGAGPLHANALGKLTGAWPVIIPPSPGVLCAYGDATTSLRNETVRTLVRGFNEFSDNSLAAILNDLATTSKTLLIQEGISEEEQTVVYSADLRYHGQGFEIPVVIDITSFDTKGGGLNALRAAFDAEHKRLFSFLLEKNEHEIVTVRATASGPRPDVASPILPEGTSDASTALSTTTEIWVEGERRSTNVFDREKLVANNVVEGPAIITEMDSTTLVLPGHAATVHPSGSLLIRPIENN